MKTFVVNEYITLKLEAGRTEIYVGGDWFRLCLDLALNITIENIEDINSINSIDELEELQNRYETDTINHHEITPETSFFVHCSNLKCWAENQYNTNLLHRNLAFPLLKRLTELGDPLAEEVFKNQIAERFASGNVNVATFLIDEGYLDYLEDEEYNTLVEGYLNSESNLSVLFILARIYYHRNENEKAIENFYKALDIDPDYYDGWLRLGRVYCRLREFKKCLEIFKKCVEIDSARRSTPRSIARRRNA